VSEPGAGRADDTAMLPATFVLSEEAVPPGPTAPPEPARSRHRRSPWRWVLLGVVGVVVLGVLYYAVTLYQVWSTGRSDQARPVDAIVVMGAAQYDGRPSPQLAARLDQVVRLWDRELAPLVVTTGGKQPGDRFTEAEASAAYLEDRGVPAEAIVLENEGSTTYESLEGVAEILDARGLSSVLVVTDPYHALRSRMVAEEVGLDAYVSPTTTSVVHGAESLRRHLQEAAGVALARPFGFDRLRGLAG
jgi:uncharacterized SAM-binding protein YcdF (DUF218 family)